MGGYSAYAGWGVYSATKFAVEAQSEALVAELAPMGVQVTVVEPGFFRTDFLDDSSLSRTARHIDQYADTVGAMRAAMGSMNHQQPGDPAKLSQAIIALADSELPPVRLPLGSDTVARIGQKHRFVEAELATWLDVARSTDFDARQAA